MTGARLIFYFLGAVAGLWAVLAALGAALDARHRRAAARKALARAASGALGSGGGDRDRAPAPEASRRRSRLNQLEKALRKHDLSRELTPMASNRERRTRERSVHMAVLRASLPSVVTKHRQVRHHLRDPGEAGGSSYKELRLVLWTVYFNHSWFSIFSVFSEDHPRPQRCLLAFFETLIIIVCEAMTFWYHFPMDMCEAESSRYSCERIVSTTSFGRTKMCAWGPSASRDNDGRAPVCEFKTPVGAEVVAMRFQMAVLSVAITLPLLKFANWVFDAYIFAPTATAADGDGRNGSIRVNGERPEILAGRRLLANLGIEDADVDWARDDRWTRLTERLFGGSAASKRLKRKRTADRVARAFAGAARWQTMRLVLRQRQEIMDAIADLDDGVYDGAYRGLKGRGTIRTSRTRKAMVTRPPRTSRSE